MTARLLLVEIGNEPDVVLARQRARQLAELLGFDLQDQTRLATAVSELARNVFQYAGGGRIEFSADQGAGGLFRIELSDRGPGIRDVESILRGDYRSKTGMGIGLAGAKKLMDAFEIQTSSTGTKVTIGKRRHPLAPPVDAAMLSHISLRLAARAAENPFEEVRQQNQELMHALEALRRREEELLRLNSQLAETNSGILALYGELEERAVALRDAHAMKNRFHSQMNHEVRTPINAILSLSEVLENGAVAPPHPEQLRPIGLIRKSARQLSELVDDLLDMAKLEAGRMAVRRTTFTVDDLFGGLRGIFRPLHVNHAVSLIFEPCERLPALTTDEGKVSQILRNFVSNALKFTVKGWVRVEASVELDQMRFTVRDSGVGVAPEERHRLFRDFEQIEGDQQSKFKGTGLGLALCRDLALLLGGSVGVTFPEDGGSSFHLLVPIHLPDSLVPPSKEVK